MSETLLDSNIAINLNFNSLSRPKFYRLKVNINGFRLEDIRVGLMDSNKEKVQVKISAFRNIKLNNQESSKEYVKVYDIFKTKSNISTDTMRYYLDKINPLYLIIEFLSTSDENVYVNLDDSCESLVEMAAKSLLNIRNIEDLKHTIEDPFNSSLNPDLDGIFSPNLIKDLNLATKTTFTPIKIIQDKNSLEKLVRIEVGVPSSIKSASLVDKTQSSDENVEPESNHIKIRFDGLKLSLDGLTQSENTTSTFSKQFSLPKGTNTNIVSFMINENRHVLIIESPYSE